MRTTIDLPPDLHRIAKSIAHDTEKSLSETIADLIRRGLERSSGPVGQITIDELTGLPVTNLGHVVTSEDVASLEDEE